MHSTNYLFFNFARDRSHQNSVMFAIFFCRLNFQFVVSISLIQFYEISSRLSEEQVAVTIREESNEAAVVNQDISRIRTFSLVKTAMEKRDTQSFYIFSWSYKNLNNLYSYLNKNIACLRFKNKNKKKIIGGGESLVKVSNMSDTRSSTRRNCLVSQSLKVFRSFLCRARRLSLKKFTRCQNILWMYLDLAFPQLIHQDHIWSSNKHLSSFYRVSKYKRKSFKLNQSQEQEEFIVRKETSLLRKDSTIPFEAQERGNLAIR